MSWQREQIFCIFLSLSTFKNNFFLYLAALGLSYSTLIFFASCGIFLLWCVDSLDVASEPVKLSALGSLLCSLRDLSSPTRDWTCVSCFAKQILNHCHQRSPAYAFACTISSARNVFLPFSFNQPKLSPSRPSFDIALAEVFSTLFCDFERLYLLRCTHYVS